MNNQQLWQKQNCLKVGKAQKENSYLVVAAGVHFSLLSLIIQEASKNTESSSPNKRHSSPQEVNSNSSYGNSTWESTSKQRKKRKYTNAYLCGYYENTKIGREECNWIVNDLNISKIASTFRQVSVEGAQLRKHLSDGLVLL